MRYPSADDVWMAQPHLVLLKSKLRQRAGFKTNGACVGKSASWSDHGKSVEGGHGTSTSSQRPAEGFAGRARGVTWDPPSATVGARPPGRTSHQSEQVQTIRVAQDNDTSHYASAGNFAGASAIDPQTDKNNEVLVPCPECGRKFKEESLEKHVRICKKVFQQKRKQFNSAANRLGDFENAQQLIAKATSVRKKNGENKDQKRTSKTIPEWQKKSLAFRQAILQAKGAEGDEDAQKKAAEIQQQLDAAGGASNTGQVQCPHCSRTFNKEAGERHIAICIKTFGSKPQGGGRLIKGGGRIAAAQPQEPRSARDAPSSVSHGQPLGAHRPASSKNRRQF